jgi:CheY-like chemotaxis protein
MKAQKILIVEDDVSHRAAMEKVLQLHGYETCSCESGEHAVQKMKEESFEILVTDFQMRGMDGLQLIREARSIKRLGDRPGNRGDEGQGSRTRSGLIFPQAC